jgi:LysM repeat protein
MSIRSPKLPIVAVALVALMAGGLLAVRSASAATTRANPNAVCAATYVIRAGDRWATIATRNKVTLANLLAANKSTAQTRLVAGRKLCVPSVCRTFVVRPRDGWTLIARVNKVAVTNLLRANTATLRTVIHPKQALCVPVRSGGNPPVPPPTTKPPVPPTTKPPAKSPQQIIRDVWPDNLEAKALAVAYRESTWQPAAFNGTCCYGLFQIHFTAHRVWLKSAFGITTAQQLFDPTLNSKVAYALYQSAGGWGPWGG